MSDTKRVLNEQENELRITIQTIDQAIGEKREAMAKLEQEINELFEQRSQNFGAISNISVLKEKLNIQNDG